MPNHVSHILTAQGPDEVLRELLEGHWRRDGSLAGGGDDCCLDLQSVIPMPAVLKYDSRGKTYYPLQRQVSSEHIAWAMNQAQREGHIAVLSALEEPPAELQGPALCLAAAKCKYGAVNWYQWAMANWDTKWGCYNGELDGPPANREVVMRFQTAWSVPMRALSELSELYPEVHFFLECMDEGYCFGGSVTFRDGKFTEDMHEGEYLIGYAERVFGWVNEDEDEDEDDEY